LKTDLKSSLVMKTLKNRKKTHYNLCPIKVIFSANMKTYDSGVKTEIFGKSHFGRFSHVLLFLVLAALELGQADLGHAGHVG